MTSCRFSGGQVTAMVIAVCGAVVLAPMTVGAATGPSVHVADPSNSSAVAHVNKAGGLAVTPRDPSSGSQARVDKGALRVGGTVKTIAGGGTQSVAGIVNVGNLPSTQTVAGTVDIGNLPSTQGVSGTVNVGNLPQIQTVSGTVSTRDNGPGSPWTYYAAAASSPCTLYSDAGNVTVVEVIGVRVAVTSGQQVEVYVDYTDAGSHLARLFVPVTFAESGGGNDYYEATLPVHLYVGAGTTPIYFLSGTPGSGSTHVTDCLGSGYVE